MSRRVIHVNSGEYAHLLKTEIFTQTDYAPDRVDRYLLGHLFNLHRGIEVRHISELDKHHE